MTATDKLVATAVLRTMAILVGIGFVLGFAAGSVLVAVLQ